VLSLGVALATASATAAAIRPAVLGELLQPDLTVLPFRPIAFSSLE